MPTILLTTNTDPGLPAISFDGHKIAVAVNGSVQILGADTNERGILLIDTTSGTYQHTEGSVHLPTNPSLSSDGATVLFQSADLFLASGALLTTPLSKALYATHIGDTQPGVANGFGDHYISIDSILAGAVLSGNGRFAALYGIEIANGILPAIFKIDLLNHTYATVFDFPYEAGTSYLGSSPALSNDGRFVAFAASQRGRLDDPVRLDVYERDTSTGALVTLNTEPDGRVPARTAFDPTGISSDGRYVAFHGYGLTAKGELDYGAGHVYVKDTRTGALIDAATSASGTPVTHPELIGLSDNGRYVAFTTFDGIGPAPHDYSKSYVYVKDLQTGGIAAFAVDDWITHAALSGDGQTLAAVTQNGAQYEVVTANLSAFMTVSSNDDIAGTANGDTLIGYLGDDRYIVNHSKDVVVEYAEGGTDTVVASVDYALPDNVENLAAAGTTALALGGNALANTITGNDAANRIDAGAGSDTVYGGAGDDIIKTGGGSDHIDAGAGNDTVILPGGVGDYIWSSENGVVTLKRVASGDVVTVTNAEHVQAGRFHIEFGENGHAGDIIRLYQAAFDRLPDAAGLGYWIKQMNAGASLDSVATAFTQSAEFSARFPVGADSYNLVEGYYQNVLHRDGDPGGVAFWTDKVDTGAVSPSVLLQQFSGCPENMAAMVGVLEKGYAFVDYA